jgi:hypothetical protein
MRRRPDAAPPPTAPLGPILPPVQLILPPERREELGLLEMVKYIEYNFIKYHLTPTNTVV